MTNLKIATAMTRKQLQAEIKALKASGKIDKKFDARQNNQMLAQEIERVTGKDVSIDAKTIKAGTKKAKATSDNVISFKDAQNAAEKRGYALEISQGSFNLCLYEGTTGRPEKFLLPSDVVRYLQAA